MKSFSRSAKGAVCRQHNIWDLGGPAGPVLRAFPRWRVGQELRHLGALLANGYRRRDRRHLQILQPWLGRSVGQNLASLRTERVLEPVAVSKTALRARKRSPNWKQD
jgi:hypothetical protein